MSRKRSSGNAGNSPAIYEGRIRAAYSGDQLPTTQQLETELNRERYKRNYRSALRCTIYTLITVSAVAVLVAVLLLTQ